MNPFFRTLIFMLIMVMSYGCVDTTKDDADEDDEITDTDDDGGGGDDTQDTDTQDQDQDAEDVLDCVPDCVDKECGDDGCGGSCGTCPLSEDPTFDLLINSGDVTSVYSDQALPSVGDYTQIAQFVYPEACTPECSGLECGDDGCGGTCGTCGSDQECYSGVCAGAGDVNVTLEWATDADLDVFVTDPGGETIFYGNTNSASGGELDVDSHADCTNPGTNGVENVFWADNNAPEGTYQVFLNNYDNCGASSTDYTVTISVLGAETVFTGTTRTTGETQNITSFENTGSCTPDCSGLECGNDGCGGTCGTCSGTQSCSEGICVGSGDVSMTLEWSTVHDLDIFVVDPNGEEISYGNLTSSSGGFLDVDSHADCVDTSGPGVENVFWGEGSAPEGMYTVYVSNYSECEYEPEPDLFCNEATFTCEP